MSAELRILYCYYSRVIVKCMTNMHAKSSICSQDIWVAIRFGIITCHWCSLWVYFTAAIIRIREMSGKINWKLIMLNTIHHNWRRISYSKFHLLTSYDTHCRIGCIATNHTGMLMTSCLTQISILTECRDECSYRCGDGIWLGFEIDVWRGVGVVLCAGMAHLPIWQKLWSSVDTAWSAHASCSL